jgi:hypothetical protein
LKRAVLAVVAALLAALSACHHQSDATLLIVVTAAGSPPPVVKLDVTLSGDAVTPSMKSYSRDDNAPIVFPTTLAAVVPSSKAGTLNVEVRAEDAAGAVVASGNDDAIMLRAGEKKTITVQLDCGGDACIVDGGPGSDGGPTDNPRCGNGRVDPGETCDTAIRAGDPGACPPSCDDHVACTRDGRTGSDCTVTCTHTEITEAAIGDGCCPTGVGHGDDPDCSSSCGNGAVETGEICDQGIAHGAPGSCPNDADCTAAGPCFHAQLVSAGTCSAVCALTPIVAQVSGDGCCPAGASHAGDDDCPSACGDGVLDREAGETCDPGIAPPQTGACPVSCDDAKPCTTDYLTGSGCHTLCVHVNITKPLSGDGCCPKDPMTQTPLATQITDSDCGPVCGNGVVERGETCDPPSSCPTDAKDCPPTPSPCLRGELVGDPANCTAHCEVKKVTACNPNPDPDPTHAEHCCPDNCTPENDYYCGLVASACGNGLRETTNGELCDTAIGPQQARHCPASCGDGNMCTTDLLLGKGSCAAACYYLPITSFLPGDGCCPIVSGVNFTVDPDCPMVCGNGVVESPRESCDYAIPGSCPDTPGGCPPAMGCTRYVVQGSRTTCDATCVATPVTACVDDDGCCPAGCSPATDSDCRVVCGDGVVAAGETCDRGITAGMPGACPVTCNDGDACTVDLASGSTQTCTRVCAHQPITGCMSGDGCCPPGCAAAADDDCSPRCGDGKVGAGETCDPPSSCPRTCPDDGDRCTADQMTGDASTCDAACRHVPITACSGAAADACCPTGCTPANDADCM